MHKVLVTTMYIVLNWVAKKSLTDNFHTKYCFIKINKFL